MTHLDFGSCPECGTTDASDFTVTHERNDMDEGDFEIFFKSPEHQHILVIVSCDNCSYNNSGSITKQL